MQLRISAPGHDLTAEDTASIERDLEKIARHLSRYKEVYTDVRINGSGKPDFHVTLEVEYRRNHLIAKAEKNDMGMAVREAREEILRQISDRASHRGSHSSYAKGR